ncbi:hypothetical protein K488DRAFT_90990 [Vararia minispora EC-137]|uniref:Uncharacterized protein n=1 Tax=Vararia minispora EC-137 TaxID=1314806 RepID=A0ACB8Q705_9AGAM|nr:hypothetical protein K488DRAFT_90990 [Vararia minispora EC-137]
MVSGPLSFRYVAPGSIGGFYVDLLVKEDIMLGGNLAGGSIKAGRTATEFKARDFGRRTTSVPMNHLHWKVDYDGITPRPTYSRNEPP